MVYVVGLSLLAKLVTRQLKRMNESTVVESIHAPIVKIRSSGESVIATVTR